MRNWSLITAGAEQTPIPHAVTCSFRATSWLLYCLLSVAIGSQERDEMAQGIVTLDHDSRWLHR
jgi:hypothetical protein